MTPAGPGPHLALVGPTASGKSEVAVAVAAALGDVEIVSVDSMQVYRGMDIGTAKLTPDRRGGVFHHLLDVCDPTEDWSVARFAAAARGAVAGIEGRGHRALFVGGTGLYARAVCDGLDLPGTVPEVRADLEAVAVTAGGLAGLYAELERADPLAASRLERTNRRRVVRAVEVLRTTGRPFSSFGPGLRAYPPSPVRLAGLWLPRPVMRARIHARLEAMAAAGLVEEVAGLRSRPLSRTASEAIGYREVLDFLAGRTPDLRTALAAATARTTAFARRQRMWFRRDPRITWIGHSGNSAVAVPALLALWKR